MCEILFNLRDTTHTDPARNLRSMKRGMAVVVMNDGHLWGRLESKQQWIAEGNPEALWPNQGVFFILKLPGVPAEKARALLELQEEDDAGVPQWEMSTDDVGNPIQRRRKHIRRRLWRLKEELVPNPVKQEIAQTGEYTTTPAAIRNYLKRIRDDAQFTGLD